jgi:hypothetical protein
MGTVLVEVQEVPEYADAFQLTSSIKACPSGRHAERRQKTQMRMVSGGCNDDSGGELAYTTTGFR